MDLGRTSRDDANDFFIVLFIERMDDEKNRARCQGTDGDPALLAVERPVALCNGARIVEYQRRSFKTNTMLRQVVPALVLVPLKAHDEPLKTGWPAVSGMSIHLYVHRAADRLPLSRRLVI